MIKIQSKNNKWLNKGGVSVEKGMWMGGVEIEWKKWIEKCCCNVLGAEKWNVKIIPLHKSFAVGEYTHIYTHTQQKSITFPLHTHTHQKKY